jgi:hypothetical protein
MKPSATRTSREETDVSVDGVDYCVAYALTVAWSRERYGADADGNRGVMQTFLDTTITLAQVDRYDEDAMTPLPLDALDPPLRRAIEAQLTTRTVDAAYAAGQDADAEADAAYDDYIDRKMEEER